MADARTFSAADHRLPRGVRRVHLTCADNKVAAVTEFESATLRTNRVPALSRSPREEILSLWDDTFFSRILMSWSFFFRIRRSSFLGVMSVNLRAPIWYETRLLAGRQGVLQLTGGVRARGVLSPCASSCPHGGVEDENVVVEGISWRIGTAVLRLERYNIENYQPGAYAYPRGQTVLLGTFIYHTRSSHGNLLRFRWKRICWAVVQPIGIQRAGWVRWDTITDEPKT
ncbi:unnamed protein product [Nesidiocoris tenuis]|uniref:Uncharacterized protein n=1 Tax=Nesidiocoris tenuis TaxID=355587 RepID=A0A6H5HNQ1_9HEMI|nr:unnamed protein product [Nesidiocoris tenuis]